jgi:hypothetical protein
MKRPRSSIRQDHREQSKQAKPEAKGKKIAGEGYDPRISQPPHFAHPFGHPGASNSTSFLGSQASIMSGQPGGQIASSYGASTSDGTDGNFAPTTMEEDTNDDLLDYEPSPACDGMDVNVTYLSSTDYSLLEEEEVSQLALGPQDTIFKKPVELGDHLKSLYIHGHLDSTPVAPHVG